MKKIIKDALVLLLITAIAGVLLGLVYKITKEPIEEQNEKAKIAAYNSAFDKLDSYEELEVTDAIEEAVAASEDAVTVNEIVKAYDASKTLLGFIITVTDSNGYGGDIKLTVGIDVTGKITGVEFLDINETAGLGMKAKEDSFKSQFAGITGEKVEYIKGGERNPAYQIDAISSATITTKAVTGGVNGALVAFREIGGVVNE